MRHKLTRGGMFRQAAFMLFSLTIFATAQAQDKPIAPKLFDLGDHQYKISTSNPEAQEFFNQGLILAYAFNHAEAERSFKEAQRLDPSCAMCFWGEALVLGPNINAAMDPAVAPQAYAAVQKAVALAPNVSRKEQAFIEALSIRYAAEAPEDRSAMDVAYADAMRTVAKKYNNDPEALTLFAESLMDTTPWDYWEEDGSPKAEAKEFLSVLEKVMEKFPQHPGANHLYIHAVEKERPELGVAAADRLGSIAPGAGHLVHMPSHIYIRVGRYHDASIANQQAIEADDSYLTQCRNQGLYPLAYMPHNHHFLWAAATFEGRSELAIASARHMAENSDHHAMRMDGMSALQHYMVTPLYALVRFGKWEEVLQEPKPARDLLYPTAIWYFAQGMAYVKTDAIAKAEKAFDRLKSLSNLEEMKDMRIWDINATADIMTIAATVLESEIAFARGDQEHAIDLLYRAVEMEDNLMYQEPADWHQPIRQMLGARLLQSNLPAEAEKVYRDDLMMYPDNGWSLYGLHAALNAQSKQDEAKEVLKSFEEAWKYADVELTASSF